MYEHFDIVGVTGFEPAASCSQSRRATNCATPRTFLFYHVFAILSSILLRSYDFLSEISKTNIKKKYYLKKNENPLTFMGKYDILIMVMFEIKRNI